MCLSMVELDLLQLKFIAQFFIAHYGSSPIVNTEVAVVDSIALAPTG